MDISFLDYPDNLVLHLERDRRSIKCFTTEQRNKFKVLIGMSDMDTIVDTTYVNTRELKQLLVDNIINGYILKLNLAFKQGLNGVLKELAAEFVSRQATQEEKKEVSAEQDEAEEMPEKYF